MSLPRPCWAQVCPLHVFLTHCRQFCSSMLALLCAALFGVVGLSQFRLAHTAAAASTSINAAPVATVSATSFDAKATAALLKSYAPSLTPAQIRAVLTSTALDIEAPSADRDSGAGIVMALQALQSV